MEMHKRSPKGAQCFPSLVDHTVLRFKGPVITGIYFGGNVRGSMFWISVGAHQQSPEK